MHPASRPLDPEWLTCMGELGIHFGGEEIIMQTDVPFADAIENPGEKRPLRGKNLV